MNPVPFFLLEIQCRERKTLPRPPSTLSNRIFRILLPPKNHTIKGLYDTLSFIYCSLLCPPFFARNADARRQYQVQYNKLHRVSRRKMSKQDLQELRQRKQAEIEGRIPYVSSHHTVLSQLHYSLIHTTVSIPTLSAGAASKTLNAQCQL